MTSEQLRAARALLGWSRIRLAKDAGVHKDTIARMEKKSGPVQAHTTTVRKIQGCLENRGVVFTDNGVSYDSH